MKNYSHSEGRRTIVNTLYSIRMRSAEGGAHEHGGRHISGAERIVDEKTLKIIAQQLIDRALHHSKGTADFINICIEKIDTHQIQYIRPLAVAIYESNTIDESHALAKDLLCQSVSAKAVECAFSLLQRLNTNMRGAILLDSQTGERLDRTGQKGIRVTRMDVIGKHPSYIVTTDNTEIPVNTHLAEALVLASKVQSCKGIVGELCWSDDPDYTVGYVACNGKYHRLQHMKPLGSDIGGRVFFIDSQVSVESVESYLESQAVLVTWQDR